MLKLLQISMLHYGQLTIITGYCLKPYPSITHTKVPSPQYDRISLKPNGQFFSIGGCSDSYYEYLLKAWVQGGKKESELKKRYDQAIDGAHELLLHRSRYSGLSYFGQLSRKRFFSTMETLTCFAPGMLFYGEMQEKSPKTQRNLHAARCVIFTCHMMANLTSSGLPPESCSISDRVTMTIPFRTKHYSLRPEIIESYYYMKETTGDPIAQYEIMCISMCRVWGWEFYRALEEHCRTDMGYGMYSDVQGNGHVQDQTESYLGAETLKYLYLLFSSNHLVDLKKELFTTEGHILPIRNEYIVCS